MVDAAERPTSVTTSYDSAAGLATSVTATGQAITTGYDTWGRVTTYTPIVASREFPHLPRSP